MKGQAYLLFFLLVIGCARKDGVPGDILASDRMESILWDMIQADQFSTQYILKDSARKNVKKETIKLYGEVFKIHNISKEEFQKSFQYYLTRPDLTKQMLDTLAERARRQRLIAGQKPLLPMKSR